MSDAIAPFSGDNIPLKELKKEKRKIEMAKKTKPKISPAVIAMAVVIAFLLMIITLLLITSGKKPPAPQPSPIPIMPSPSPVSTTSALPKSVGERLEKLEKGLNEVDLYQTELSFPLLDFNLNFEKQR